MPSFALAGPRNLPRPPTSHDPVLPPPLTQAAFAAAAPLVAIPAAHASEVAQVAGEAGFIFGTSTVMFGITLVGLAVGFVLLRVESLVEDGEIDI